MAGVAPVSELDLGQGQEGDPVLTSMSHTGTSSDLNYDHSDVGTSFSSDRVEKASDAEWSSLNNPLHESEGKSRVFKGLSNILERDAPLDFSVASILNGENASSSPKLKISTPSTTFTPLGDIPAAPAVPTSVAEAFATAQFQKARELFSVGMSVDPQHGPLYHAYGNMELVNSCVVIEYKISYHTVWHFSVPQDLHQYLLPPSLPTL